eukprot:Opistho-2@57329
MAEAVGGAAAGGDDGSNRFMGQKERRRSSAVKMFLGDHLGLASNVNVVKLLAKNDDKKIVFSDVITKINKRNKMQERVFLMTDTAMYNLEPNSYKCKRRIPLKEIGSVSLSKLPDNFFALHVPTEYDYLLVSSKKTEIVSKILEAYEAVLGKELPITFANSFDYRIDQDTVREIHFSRVDGGVSTQIYTKKKSRDAKK